MMTLEQVKQYDELDNIFVTECVRVSEIIGKYEYCHKEPFSRIEYAEDWSICGDEVCWKGYDYDNDLQCGIFPAKYLTMANDEVDKAAKAENEAYLKKEEARKAQREEMKREHDYKEYLRLKEQFEK